MKKFILMFLFVVALTSCKKGDKQMMEKTSDSNSTSSVEEVVNQQNDSITSNQSDSQSMVNSSTDSNESTEAVIDETINNDVDENK